MVNNTDKVLFLLGLVIFSFGQVWIYHFGSTNKTLSKIDIAHWIMLISTVFYLPFIMRLPRNGIAIVASILMTIGAVCMIGMCVIDFVLWGIPNDELRSAVAGELMNTPSIWQPFMLWGNEEVLMAGFVFASLLYFRQSKIGTLSVLIGAVVAIAGPSWFNLAGYIFTIVGFLFCFEFFKINKSGAGEIEP